MVVIFVLDHFWSHVFQRAAEGVPLLHMVGLYAPAKVADLNNIALFDQNVLWLDVSMYETLLMQIVDARADLNEEVECSVLA